MSRPSVVIEVVAGGRPDAVTLVAIERAVHRVLARRRPQPDGAGPATPAWRRAALREGVGGARAVRPDRRG